MPPEVTTNVHIDQIPDERLAVLGWNARENQDALRRQIESHEQVLSTIRAELQRRNEVRVKAEQDKDKVQEVQSN